MDFKGFLVGHDVCLQYFPVIRSVLVRRDTRPDEQQVIVPCMM